MNLNPPAQLYSTTLYDRHQPQQSFSFIFIPARSLTDSHVPDLSVVQGMIEPNATYFKTIAPSFLPAALASLLPPEQPNPFSWAETVPTGTPIWIHPNAVGFAEYVAFSEAPPFEGSPLRSRSLMAIAVGAGVQIGLIAGGGTPLVLVTVPAGIVLCTAGVVLGPALGKKVGQLIGA